MSRELELARELARKLEEAEKDNKVQLSELQPGETFKIGEHDFIVLEQNVCNGTTNVISKGFMASFIPNTDDWWWLATPWSTKRNDCEYSVSVVSPCGYFGNCFCGNDCGVRPFCIFSSELFESED